MPLHILYIDIDLDGSRRDELVQYLVDKYGENYVALVGTSSKYSSKSAIRDLGTVYGIPPSQSVECTKEFNDKMTVRENMKMKPKVKKYFEAHPELIDKIDQLVGTISNLGIHAGGVVISSENYPIKNYCALQRPAEGGRVATLWGKEEISNVGFIKYDILGLSSCAQIHKAIEMIGRDPYVDLPEDPEVYKEICMNAKNKNIFQFESFLGQKAFEDFLPANFTDVANASSILRIIGSSEGRAVYKTYKDNVEQLQQGNVNYWKEQLRDEIIEDTNYEIAVEVLSDSYGVLIFQEQLAELVSRISDRKLTFGHADIFRRKLYKHGSKYGTIDDNQGNKEALKKWHTAFMKHFNEYLAPHLKADLDLPDVQSFINFELDGENNLITPKKGIVSWIISSAAYLFNKLHAVAYTVNTYNMMWLKCYYPLEFWTASLQLWVSKLDKIRNYISAIKAEEPNITILAPCINKSDLNFTYNNGDKNEIQYGLQGILGLGKSAEVIIDERKQNGEYKNPKNFLNRVPGRKVNVKTIYHLITVNAFREFGNQKEVWDEFVNLGKNLQELPEGTTDIASLEAKLLGVNVSFKHPIMDQAALYLPLDEIEEGVNEVVALRILKRQIKQTAKGKSYNMFQVECLNCGKTVNLFDWQNRDIKTDYLICRVKMNNNFYQLLGPSQYAPINKATKAAMRKMLNK